MGITAHLLLNGKPYCEYLNCQAGRELAEESGVKTCDYPSIRQAMLAARQLRKFRHTVRVVRGECPLTPWKKEV